MKLAVALVGIVLMSSTTPFGSATLRHDHALTDPPKKFVSRLIDDVARTISFTVASYTVPAQDIAEQLAALREPEGPPLAPPDAPIEALCDSIATAAQAHGLPTGFFARLIWQESKFRQRVVSPAGAQGVAQFMPAVAVERGLRNPFDAVAAIPQSARFLREHVDTFGNLGLAAAAYNGGARRVTEWLSRRGKLPEETRNYVKIITGHEPEQWLETKDIALPVELPRRAPCDGIADLSHTAEAASIAVQLEPQMAKLVEEAKIAAAKAEEARRVAAAKAEEARRVAAAKAEEARRIAVAKAEEEAKASKLAAAERNKRARLMAKGKTRGDNAKTQNTEKDKAPDKPADKTSANLAPEKAAKVAEIPVKKPAKAATNAADRVAAKPAEKSSKPRSKAAERVAEKPADKPAKANPKIADRVGDKAAEKSAKAQPKIADRVTDKPASANRRGVKVADAAPKR